MTSAPTLELKQSSLKSLEWAFKSFSQDLEALPEEAFDRHFGGKARTVADFVQEVIMVNDHIRLTITEQELFPWPQGWITAPEGQRSKDAVCSAFQRSAAEFMSAVESFQEGQMLDPIKSDDAVTTRFERCRFVAWHAGYHSGQLNFIQTLLGDDQWHWK